MVSPPIIDVQKYKLLIVHDHPNGSTRPQNRQDTAASNMKDVAGGMFAGIHSMALTNTQEMGRLLLVI